MSDKEYAVHRKNRELEEKVRQLENEIATLKKKLERQEPKENKKIKVNGKKEIACPTCGAVVKLTVLGFGTLHLCSAGCGYRDMVKK